MITMVATKTSEVEVTRTITTTTTAILRIITTTVATLLSRCQEAVEDVALTHLHTEVSCCVRMQVTLLMWVQFSLLLWIALLVCDWKYAIF